MVAWRSLPRAPCSWMAWAGQRAIGCHGRLVMEARHGGHWRSTGRASDGPTKEADKPGGTAMTEDDTLSNADMGAAFLEDATDEENRSSPARPLLRAYIVREGEVVCCAEGMIRGECRNWGGQKRRSVCRRDVLCGLACSTAALIGMTSPSRSICRWATRANPTRQWLAWAKLGEEE
jgi:hypothetical protein